jgi:signal transduction histidine kinase
MMKRILQLLLLFPVCIFAQQREVFRIDSLPKEGVLLNQGWKWHAGDNPEWAKAEFDDAGWKDIDPTKDIFDEVPEIPKPSGVCWFRLHLRMDSKLQQKILSFSASQSGASELYANGSRVWSIGVISSDPAKIQAFDPAYKPIPYYNPDSTLVLAIRYTLQPKVKYTNILLRKNPVFSIRFNYLESAQYQYKKIHTRLSNIVYFRFGVFIILLIGYLSLYTFYPSRIAYLYFSLFAIFGTISDISQLLGESPTKVSSIYYLLLSAEGFYMIATFCMLTALYALIGQKKTWLYWSLLGLVALSIVSQVLIYNNTIVIELIIPNFINIEIVRITLKSVKGRKKGALIIAAGGISFTVFWIAFILLVFMNGLDISIFNSFYTVGDIVYNIAILSIPIAVSIYSGYEVALNNRSLGQKLDEVEILSAEKQQLLASQNETLERQVAERTAALKASQAQLIQSEKLASLGELTAGIAHEIQNPLNFVNNFSELSVELAEELKEEINKLELDKGLIEELAADLATNQEKINHHGKRASAIVKGMLEHSRTGDAMNRVSTDLNALADEYLRLAYHGLRAKDSSFNAIIETHFDPDLPKIEVIPQDIGRVLLNLINNAFYAVAERSRSTVNEKARQGIESYSPTVTLSTRLRLRSTTESTIEISVKDNGNGIPEAIKDKIFQPFFTTKPTGQGTGLGLSLAYDIVTKGHGGSLEVKTTVDAGNPNAIAKGLGTEFIITLPRH